MIMVHDPGQENTFMVNGYGVNRKIIAYNFFIIVGPKNDPANVTGHTPIAAMKKIYQFGTKRPSHMGVKRRRFRNQLKREKPLESSRHKLDHK